jgi:hypothetical protein
MFTALNDRGIANWSGIAHEGVLLHVVSLCLAWRRLLDDKVRVVLELVRS